MKNVNKTSAWIRLVAATIIAVALIAVLVLGIANGGVHFPIFSFGGSFNYPNGDKYTAGDTTITADQLKEIEINWTGGLVRIETYEGDTIQIHETASSSLSADDRVHSYYDNNGKLSIQYRKSQFMLFSSYNGSKELYVKIPSRLAGDIHSLSLDSVSAECSITGLTVKDVEIDNVSGGITVDSNVESFELDTVSGDCSLTSQTVPHEVSSDSVSGDFTLTVPADASFSIEQDSVSGDVDSEFTTSSKNGRLICGDGKNDWEFDSVSGDVYVRKLTE